MTNKHEKLIISKTRKFCLVPGGEFYNTRLLISVFPNESMVELWRSMNSTYRHR